MLTPDPLRAIKQTAVAVGNAKRGSPEYIKRLIALLNATAALIPESTQVTAVKPSAPIDTVTI